MREGITRLTYQEIENNWLARVKKIYEGMNQTENIRELVDFLRDPAYTITFRYALCRFLREKYGKKDPQGGLTELSVGEKKIRVADGPGTPLEEEVEDYILFMQYLSAQRGMKDMFQGKHLRLYLKGRQEHVSRETLFKMAFAFDMDTEAVCELLESMDENPYNFRSAVECIYYFCNYAEETNHWETAQTLLRQYQEEPAASAAGQQGDMTAFIRKSVENLHYEVEDVEERCRALLSYLNERREAFSGYSRTSYGILEDLLGELSGLTGAEDDTELSIALWEPIWVQFYTRKSEKTGVNRADFVPFKDLLDLPKVIYEKPLWRARIQKLRTHSVPVEKRDILFLNCMKWTLCGDCDGRKGIMNEFLLETNDLLLDCGLSVVYPPNPYDRMILLAVSSESPYDVLSDIFQVSTDEEKLEEKLAAGRK